ncbi:zinc protease [Sphingomonas zeicaulis]|uniref:M16 family metallopeptidase n=1 Tax=Sphingomonas zeicaulis TaxID=1632740 RepID=UPI003D22D541
MRHMRSEYRRFARFALPLIAVMLVAPQIAAAQQQSAPTTAQPRPAPPAPQPAPAAPTTAPAPAAKPWLYERSDIPPDTNWRFGTLANGLRYATRANGVPPGQVSVRVAIDAGSLMEQDGERGFAHFIEHLSFRGSTHVPDGEAKRIWQRLGASFGSDTNAQTTPTQTIYKLDLPRATPESLDESLKMLAGMMSGPTFTKSTVDTERAVVLAENRESQGAQRRAFEVQQGLFFAGQPLANRMPIGTIETLRGATAESLRAFHDRWYRPGNAVIAIAGDGDPAIFAQMIEKHFSAWQPKGPNPPEPNFGDPDPNQPVSRVLVEPSLPPLLTLATLRPWRFKDDTIVYNQGKMLDQLAMMIINRRLETRARAGGSYIAAQVSFDDVARSANATTIFVQPIGEDWKTALTDVRTVIAQAKEVAPSQAEIEREWQELDEALNVQVQTSRTEAAAKQAEDILQAVNIRETTASPQVILDIFRGMKGQATPQRMLEGTRRLFTGTADRALMVTPKDIPNGGADLAAAMKTEIKVDAAEVRKDQAPIGFDRVPSIGGTPATVVTRQPLSLLNMETVELSNGVRLVLFPNNAEANKIMVNVRFGGGVRSLSPKKQTPHWAGEAVLYASGIGDLGADELDRLTSARRIGIQFETEEDAFELKSVTRAADLEDQLHLMAAQLSFPKWDEAPIKRLRAAMLAGYEAQSANASAVMNRELPSLLKSGDPRWTTPDRKDIETLNGKAFRRHFEPLLKEGPIEILLFGDFDAETAIAAAEKTFGALAKRKPVTGPGAPAVFPAHNAKPELRYHNGPADQAAAAIAWPTGGGIAGIAESRRLEVLSQIFSDRLFDRFRQEQGASYSPFVSTSWPVGMDTGGYIFAMSQIEPDQVAAFYRMVNEIAVELSTKPVTADELERAVGPMQQYVARASSGNTFWIEQLGGVSTDPRRAAALRQLPQDLASITPELLQATAAKYLLPGKSFSLTVLPKPGAPATEAPAVPATGGLPVPMPQTGTPQQQPQQPQQ